MSESLPLIIFHILSNLHKPKPLFVALQGPQGSGKTYLTSVIRNTLTSVHSLSVAVISIDDLYLSHTDLVALADAHPKNGLLKGRGLPGTHDLPLARKVLNDLKNINEPPLEGKHRQVTLPSFDKGLYHGEGDRSPEGVVVTGPVDVIILEGWCVGFYPITTEELRKRWEVSNTRGVGDLGYNIGDRWAIEDIRDVNERLKEYVPLWEFFEVFIQIKPIPESPYSFIHKWRLEQEHSMKTKNGGNGMSDEDVRRFVDRYIPGYVFFGDGVTQGLDPCFPSPSEASKPPWLGKGLLITIGDKREVVDVGSF